MSTNIFLTKPSLHVYTTLTMSQIKFKTGMLVRTRPLAECRCIAAATGGRPNIRGGMFRREVYTIRSRSVYGNYELSDGWYYNPAWLLPVGADEYNL